MCETEHERPADEAAGREIRGTLVDDMIPQFLHRQARQCRSEMVLTGGLPTDQNGSVGCTCSPPLGMAILFPNSPFADRLGTNYIPSDQEIEDLRYLLVDPIEELGRVDAHIDEMEARISELKAERTSLNALIDAHKVLLSPIRRVPQNVLQGIFLACLPTSHDALVDPNEMPMFLGRHGIHLRSVA
ncbi:hypothetical protein C8R44DRAFT_754285 [Mycena epipterygia]|nr:hypothetical protein C8R44DRAFT_754285 [Mycena epipterygia]